MPLSDAQKAEIEKIFLSFNETGSDRLTFPEFHQFLSTAWSGDSILTEEADDGLSDELSRFIFDGAASSSKNSVSFDEISPIIDAIADDDFDFFVRFAFKGLDPDRTGQIAVDRVPDATKLLGIVVDVKKNLAEKIRLEIGEDKKQLTYEEFYQLVMNDPKNRAIESSRAAANDEKDEMDADGEDEKKEKKSSCCLLL